MIAFRDPSCKIIYLYEKSEIYPPFRTSRTSHELTHAKKTLVALATLSALGMASGSASAWSNITQTPVDKNWELTVKGPDYPGSTQADFVLSSAPLPENNTDAVIDLTFTDDLYAKVNVMDETMGKWGSLNEDQREDYWSTVSGLHFYGTDSATYTSLDIDLTANTTDASKGTYELAGIYLTGANDLTVGPTNGKYEGTTNISVTGNYDVPTSEDKPSSLSPVLYPKPTVSRGRAVFRSTRK